MHVNTCTGSHSVLWFNVSPPALLRSRAPLQFSTVSLSLKWPCTKILEHPRYRDVSIRLHSPSCLPRLYLTAADLNCPFSCSTAFSLLVPDTLFTTYSFSYVNHSSLPRISLVHRWPQYHPSLTALKSLLSNVRLYILLRHTTSFIWKLDLQWSLTLSIVCYILSTPALWLTWIQILLTEYINYYVDLFTTGDVHGTYVKKGYFSVNKGIYNIYLSPI